MAGIDPEKIKAPARYPSVMDINGYEARLIGMKPSKNQDNEDTYEVIINADHTLIKRENLKPEKLDNQGLYHFEVLCENLVQLNPDPIWPTYLLLTTYGGKETNVTNLLKGISQQNRIIELKKKIREAEAKIDVLNEKVYDSETNQIKSFERTVVPYFEKTVPILKDIISKDNKDN